MKRWNWGGFLFMLVICMLGALSNKNVHSILDALILTGILGVPLALLLAWVSKEEKA